MAASASCRLPLPLRRPLLRQIVSRGMPVLVGLALIPCAAVVERATVGAQAVAATAAPARLSTAELQALAQAQVAIAVVLDSSGAELAQVKNKTPQAQAEMHERRQQLIAAALTKHGLNAAEFERRRYIVSTDARMRFQLDSMVAKLTGQPLPGAVLPAAVAAAPANPMAAAAANLPATLAGIAIGYVAVAYLDTPDRAGLASVAQTEARIAAQHAGFMARALDNLTTLQMHAGHVLHALDPELVPQAKAPGKGYGVRRALDGVVAYTDFAAKQPGASPNMKTHATHIIGAARSSSARVAQAIAIARRIQGASSAAAAAALVGQLQSLCDQITTGNDLNADGRVAWGDGEGGLQQLQEHLALLLAGEKKP